MRILLTNDDGYRALGINTLYKALLEAGHEVKIVAPELNSSGAGQSITVYSPMTLTQVDDNIFYVFGTPADSVRLGLQEVYNLEIDKPDIVLSGINMGENVGEDVLYSGTVGAAREGRLHGISSIAVSTSGSTFNYLADASLIVIDLLKKIEMHKQLLKDLFIWNVNIPNKPYSEIKGFEATELLLRPIHLPLEKQITPRGNTVYWQGSSQDPEIATIGTDLHSYLLQEKVSITPLELLPTDYNQMPIISALTS